MNESKVISWREFFPVMCDALGLSEDDLKRVRRIVIDGEIGDAVRIYVEFFADDQLIESDALHLLRGSKFESWKPARPDDDKR